jgi:3-mercaptopropionate dioxygenase
LRRTHDQDSKKEAQPIEARDNLDNALIPALRNRADFLPQQSSEEVSASVCPESFRKYIASVKAVLVEVASTDFESKAMRQRQIVSKIVPLVESLLKDRDFLPAEFKTPLPQKLYSKYLLYKAEDSSFIVVAMVWRPGVVTPIHDHQTWGVIGVLQGREEETRYDRVDDSAVPGFAKIRQVGVMSYGPGEVSVCCLPLYDIHSVKNVGSEVAISIHTYGGDQSSIESCVYDPSNSSIRKYVSPCDPLPQRQKVLPLLAAL